MPYAILYEQALDHGRRQPDFAPALERWRRESPEQYGDADLLAEYAWVAVGCGLTYPATNRIYGRLEAALGGFAPSRLAAKERALRPAATAVLRAQRKLDAIFGLAGDLVRRPGQMQRLAAMPWREAQGWMLTLPLIGPNNCYHLARNLGWDVAVRTGPVARLAARLGLEAPALCRLVADEVGEKVRVVDLVLWQWLVALPPEQVADVAELARLVG